MNVFTLGGALSAVESMKQLQLECLYGELQGRGLKPDLLPKDTSAAELVRAVARIWKDDGKAILIPAISKSLLFRG